MRSQFSRVMAAFFVIAPPIAGLVFNLLFRVFDWINGSTGSAFYSRGYSLSLKTECVWQDFFELTAICYFIFGLPALVAGLAVSAKAYKTGAAASGQFGLVAGAMAGTAQALLIMLAAPWGRQSFWTTLLGLGILSMAVAAAFCTTLTRRWQ